MSCPPVSIASATRASLQMASDATGSRRSGVCSIQNPSQTRRQFKPIIAKLTIRPRTSLAPNAVVQWSSLRPSCAAKHPSVEHRHGRTPHDTNIKSGPSLCGRRTHRCGHPAKTYATTGQWRQNGMSISQIGLGKSAYLRCLSSHSRWFCTSITAAIVHNPHSTEIRPRFPPCQICRRCISR